MKEFIFSELDSLLKIMKDGLDIALELRNTKLEVIQKPDGSKVTNVDLTMNNFFQLKIREIFGNVNFLSEENDQTENAKIKTLGRYFLIDPIDGTDSFIKGGEFSINLAFIENQKVILSIVAISTSGSIIFNNFDDVYEIIGEKVSKIKKIKNYNLSEKLKISIGTNTNNNKNFMDNLNNFLQQNNKLYEINLSTAGVKFFNFIKHDDLFCLSYSEMKDWDIQPFLLFFDLLAIPYHIGDDLLVASKSEDILNAALISLTK